MEKSEIRDWVSEITKTLNQSGNCLARIEERLGHFSERLQTAEEKLEDITNHVQGVRTVSKVFSSCLAVVTAAAAALKLFRAF